MFKILGKFTLYLILFTLLLFFIQNKLSTFIVKEHLFFIQNYSIYIYLFCITFISFFILTIINKYSETNTGFGFLALGIIKMGISIFYLFPLIQSKISNKIPDVFAFFIPFFLFLLFETIFSIKILESKTKK
jgi:hypothetical protein